jgi:Acetoacetate decarboxylase (ADC)
MTDFFSNTRPGTEVVLGGATFELPILYFRDDVFVSFHTADYDRVRALMPSDRLHPVRLPGGRTLVGVAAFNYVDTSIGPYGEVAVVVPAVHGDRLSVPVLSGLLAGLLEARYPGFGNVVLHLPVTRTIARDAGRGEWGYTKFVADMRFSNTPEHHECQLAEGGRHILTLRVAKRGMVSPDRKPLVTYSVRGGELIRTVIPQVGMVRNALWPLGSFLELGDHEVAGAIGELDVSSQPFMTRYYLERSGILPSGKVVERDVRPLEGYYGSDPADGVGEHVVTYT